MWNDPFSSESESSDIVFRDMIMLALAGFIAIVILIIAHINPKAKNADGEVNSPGNIIVEMFWPDGTNVDMDLWVRGPDGVAVGYSNMSGPLFNILRDDLGLFLDLSTKNYESAYSRGIPPGEYTVTGMFFADRSKQIDMNDMPEEMKKEYKNKVIPTPIPLPVEFLVSLKSNPHSRPKQLLQKIINFDTPTEEITVWNFTIDNNGNLVESSVNDIENLIAQNRKAAYP